MMQQYGWTNTDPEAHFKSWTARRTATGRQVLAERPEVLRVLEERCAADLQIYGLGGRVRRAHQRNGEQRPLAGEPDGPSARSRRRAIGSGIRRRAHWSPRWCAGGGVEELKRWFESIPSGTPTERKFKQKAMQTVALHLELRDPEAAKEIYRGWQKEKPAEATQWAKDVSNDKFLLEIGALKPAPKPH